MMQSPAGVRRAKAPSSLFVPPVFDPVERRKETRAALAVIDEQPIFQEPEMESALRPLMWLLVPFVVTLAYGLLAG